MPRLRVGHGKGCDALVLQMLRQDSSGLILYLLRECALRRERGDVRGQGASGKYMDKCAQSCERGDARGHGASGKYMWRSCYSYSKNRHIVTDDAVFPSYWCWPFFINPIGLQVSRPGSMIKL